MLQALCSCGESGAAWRTCRRCRPRSMGLATSRGPCCPSLGGNCPAAERKGTFVPGLLAPVLHFVLHKLSDDVETLKILRDYVFVLNLYAKGLLEEYD